jgi:signal transduction histidine kinase
LWRQSQVLQSRPEIEALAVTADGPTTHRNRLADLYRGGFGVALVIGAVLLFLSANNALGQARDVILAAIAAIFALALILAPFLWRLGRNLATERAARIRSQERAELAAHLHDSVLQTLTLVQKRAHDPHEVAQLARRQERELRSWLFDAHRPGAADSLAAALEAAAVEVEEAHGVPIEVVVVGDTEVDERGGALVAAAREALVNAAKFAPDAGEVAVYAELDEDLAQVFVRDRGPGFQLASVPGDRRGVRESIVGRMERFGGRAEVRSRPGAGTEVELTMPRSQE